MDLQGTPLPPTNRGTKVTHDPRSQQPVEEPSGPVTNDSLAAESVRQGGGFSANRGAEPMGVSGDQSTVNNTDTSASIKLPSAQTAAQRQDRHEEQKYPECVVGQGNFPGTMSENGYAGGPTATKKEMGIKAGEYSTTGGSSGRSQPSDKSQPDVGASENKRGGLPSDNAKNVSFDSEIGSSQDPGREALNRFERSNAHSAYDSARPHQKGTDGHTIYENLESDQRA